LTYKITATTKTTASETRLRLNFTISEFPVKTATLELGEGTPEFEGEVEIDAEFAAPAGRQEVG
jgi:hypothetical protein